MKREIYFTPAFDRRDTNPSKNYGIHGVEMRFVVIGDKGAVQFLLFTNWHLPHVAKELFQKQGLSDYNFFEPMPADIGYHSPKPMYEGQEPVSEHCEYLDGKPCYYDGSGLQAKRYYEILVEQGGEALWESLEQYYKELFESEEA